MKGNGTNSQRFRLLAELRNRPVSTIYARKYLDILHPAMRVKELRDKGFNILTHKKQEETQRGRKHTVAEYVLLAGGE